MKHFFTEKSEQKLFSGRDFYLEHLFNLLDLVKKGQRRNIAFFGYRGTGKSSLVKEFVRRVDDKDVASVFVDLNRMSLSPENFTVEFIVNVSAWIFDRDYKWISQNSDIEGLRALKQILKKASSEIVDKVVNELEKIKPNQQFLVELAFNFAQAVAEENSKKIALVIENFDRVTDLNGFEQVSDVFSAIKFEQKNLFYVVTSSAIAQFKPIISKYNFECVEIGNFSKEETKSVVEKISGKVGSEVVNLIYSLTLGHPYYVSKIAKKFKETGSVKKAFVLETLSKDGEIYKYCDAVLSEAFSRARGKTLLTVILNVLSRYDKLRLTEISRKIFRSAPVTKSLLTRLVEVELISKSDNFYAINDNVLRYFISKRNSGISFEPDAELIKKLEEEL